MASPDPGHTPAQGEESASPSSWPPRKLQSFTPGLWSQYKAYEDAVVENIKGTIADALVLVREHQAEAIGCATVAGFILFRGPRRFLYRNTFGRLKTEKDLLNDAEQSMMEYQTSIQNLKKESKYTLDKVAIGLMDRLRTIPTRQSLELRAEVASMASDLKNQRCALQERINKISEYGVRV
ncbi:hypothetical protein Zm00014a_031417 [Zea mays]|uniref:Uncharacterized protein n=1 Tax=Zea mays TaxID=4577 RepID=A0A3L6D7I8_MAIZE|nr:hypothetical protein Zm00014a_031417 [Zea mays]